MEKKPRDRIVRESMVFYRGWAEGIEDLDEKDQLEAFWNLIRYGLDGTEPTNKGPARSVFRLAKPQIDANNAKYQNSLKGGRRSSQMQPGDNQTGTKKEPRGNQTETKAEPKTNQTGTKEKPKTNQTETKPLPHDNDNVNDNALKEMILSRLVDTFISKISLTMLPVPKPHNTACVLSWEEARRWQSRSSGYSSS